MWNLGITQNIAHKVLLSIAVRVPKKDACYTRKKKVNFCTLLLVSISAG